MKRFVQYLTGLILGLGIMVGASALATPSPKYFVCKYVGTPGVNETLQTGQNPISVSGNALPNGTTVGSSFADAQGRSYVVAEDTGQEVKPSCPVPENPPVDVCPNIDGNQATVPEGKVKDDAGNCIVLEGQGGDGDEPQVQGENTSVPVEQVNNVSMGSTPK